MSNTLDHARSGAPPDTTTLGADAPRSLAGTVPGPIGAADLIAAMRLSVQVQTIGGLPIAVIDRARSARLMLDLALARRERGHRALVITSANGQVLSMCAQDARIRDLFLGADLIHADGMPLVFASRLLSKLALPERVATTDLFHDVAAIAPQYGARFHLLGATSATIEATAARVRELYPALELCGYRSGYFGTGELPDVIAAINAARPDILWIGMGAPAELAFALRHRDQLSHVGVIKTSGGLFDFLSGVNSRAPQWMQAAGLEWAYRLGLEPRRLAARYMVTNPHALFLLLTQTGARKLGTYPHAERERP